MSQQTVVNTHFTSPLGPIYITHGYERFREWYQTAEKEYQSYWINTIKPDWTVIDAGANVGLFSIIFGKLAKQVYAFEPSDTVLSLEKNLQINNITNVQIVNLALGDKVESRRDFIYQVWGEHPIESIFDFTTIDAFLSGSESERNIHIDAIKIDVDGFDYEVLLGAENTLRTQRPIVGVEVNSALNTRQITPDHIFNFMNRLNYKLLKICDNENYVFVPL